MKLRPLAAYWFEVVVPHGDAEDTMEALARRAQVMFEWHGDNRPGEQIENLRPPVARYRELSGRYAQFWPPLLFQKRCCDPPIEAAAKAALRRIEGWLDAARPQLEEHARLEEEQTTLQAWPPILQALEGSGVDLGRLARAGPVLSGVCAVLPGGAKWPMPVTSLQVRVPYGDGSAGLALVPATELEGFCAGASTQGGQCLRIQDCFVGDAPACTTRVATRTREIGRRIRDLEGQLRALGSQHRVDQAAAVLERIDWFLDTARDIQCDGEVCWITGWTSEPDRSLLEGALQEVDVHSPVQFRDPPETALTPSVSTTPVWLRPFEVFTRAIGVPALDEADPTTWVALLVPLLFGYMCGDLGHGLVMVLAGLLLRRRTTLWPLLVFCGLAAAAFGFVYGDVFGYEGVIEPLWVRPLEDPLLILIAPVLGGTLVLTVGVLLHAVQTCWRGEGRSQGVADAAQLLVYWGVLLLFVEPAWGWLAVAGVALCAANQLIGRPKAADFAGGLGHLAQSTFEMVLNTLSFARVGAFALAHSALESTVVILAGDVSIPGLSILIIALGNLLVIVLETVVVSVQTTRLVLFEFFARFFTGAGRQLEPAVPPQPGSKGAAVGSAPPRESGASCVTRPAEGGPQRY
jgi:V/A-type H+-transporting ATPase subunit I